MITHLEFRHFSPKAPKSWLLGFPGPCLVRPWLNCWLPSGSPVAHGRPVRGRVPFKWHSMELIYQINNYVSNLYIYILTLQTFLRCFHNLADENALPNTHTQTFHKQPAVFFRMYRLRLRNKDQTSSCSSVSDKTHFSHRVFGHPPIAHFLSLSSKGSMSGPLQPHGGEAERRSLSHLPLKPPATTSQLLNTGMPRNSTQKLSKEAPKDHFQQPARRLGQLHGEDSLLFWG